MKGTDASTPTGARKKARPHLKEMDSAHDQAEPYRLMTAKFPIDELTPEWSMGANRSVDEAHKRRLCQIFRDSGVLRRDASHRLRVLCTKIQS